MDIMSFLSGTGLFLILGITGLVYPVAVQSNTVWKEIPVSLLAIVVLYVLSNNFLFQEESVISRIDGVILLALFGGFMYYIYSQMKVEGPDIDESSIKNLSNSFSFPTINSCSISCFQSR